MLELILRDQLQESCENYIIDLQTWNSESVKDFFLFVSNAAAVLATFLGLLIYIPTQNKVGTVLVIMTMVSIWLGVILKMLYSHPRPFWVNSQIAGLSCSLDFGAPSGHALVVGSVILYIYAVSLSKIKIASTVMTALLIALIGLDRNYIGVHFVFQVVLGYSIAAFYTCAWMSETAWRLVDEVKTRKVVACTAQAACAVGALAVWLLYFVRNPEFEENWNVNFKNNCGGKELSADDALFESVAESAGVWMLSGFLLGIYFLRVKSKKSIGYYAAAYTIFFVFAAVEGVVEYYAKDLSKAAEYFVLAFIRFAAGFYAAFGVPYLLSLYFQKAEEELATDFELKAKLV